MLEAEKSKNRVAAYHGLDRLGQHFPGIVEIGGQPRAIGFQLAQAAQRRIERQQRVAEGDAHVAQDGGIGQVALHARHRQLVRQVAQHRVGEAKVAFCILEVDRIDLVRHGRAADLAFLELLLEVAERHVHPDVAAGVEQHRVGAGDGVVQLGHRIVRLDLDGVGIERQAERLDELPGERLPVEIRIGGAMRVVVAHRAVELGQQFDPGDAAARAQQARGDVGHLLAERGRTGRLAVGARKHGRIGEVVRQFAQSRDDFVEGWQQHAGTRFGQHQRMRRVVDVFRGAGEVDELRDLHHFGVVAESLLEPVLHRLDVMVRARLDRLDLVGIDHREVGNHFGQLVAGRRRERRDFLQAGRLRQCLQPGDLDADAVADQPVLRKVRAQRGDLVLVTTVERRKCGKRGEFHLGRPAVRKACDFSMRPWRTAAPSNARPRARDRGLAGLPRRARPGR